MNINRLYQWVNPASDFQKQTLDDIKRQENQKCVVIWRDEMQIKDLVFDKRGERMVGFIDSKNWTSNAVSDKSVIKKHVSNSIATHVLYIVGVSSHDKSSVGYFATKGPTANYIFSLFWRS